MADLSSSSPDGYESRVVDPSVRSKLVSTFARHHALSPREEEVVRLFAAGLGTKEIAFRLGLSRTTVDVYWLRIKRKVNCDSPLHVVCKLLDDVLALKHGAI